MVEEFFDITLDRDSFHYSRFAMHLRYLVQRMMQGEPVDNDPGTRELFNTVRREYPQIYTCVQQIVRYFSDTWHWDCSVGEQLYLMIHIHRVTTDRSGGK